MNTTYNRQLVFVLIAILLESGTPGLAFYGKLSDAAGNCAFSQAFAREYDAAWLDIHEKQSTIQLEGLLNKYTNAAEQAELELSLGLAYNQHSGVINHEKGIEHFTRALNYSFSEEWVLRIYLLRGNSFESLMQYENALRDYLRGLVACSYHDIPKKWPWIQPTPIPIYTNSSDPNNKERSRDYRIYRLTLDWQQFLLSQRFQLIMAVNRVSKNAQYDDTYILKALSELTPDSSRYELIINLLKADNLDP